MPNVDLAREHILTAQTALDCALTALDAEPVEPTGDVIYVREGESLQAAIDGAPGGTEIRVYPATYPPLVVHERADGGAGGVVTIRPDTNSLPAGRCDPSWAEALVKISSAGGYPAIDLEAGAHGYRFCGVQPLASEPGAPLLRIGTSTETDPARCPGQITIDQCLLLANPERGGKRGIEANGGELRVTRSHFDHFWASQDAQGIGGWNGPGPFFVEDNYIAATGENIILGGADATNALMLPAALVVRHNTLTKRLEWKTAGEPCVKNAFELKACLSALVEHNLIEYSWTDGQVGMLVLFTVRNQDGGAPFTQVRDVTMRYNVLRHAAGGWSMLGRDDIHPSEITRNILIEQNLVYELDPWIWPGNGRCVQLLDGVEGLTIAHNTILARHHNSFLTLEGPHQTSLQMRDNVLCEGEYGIMGSGLSPGCPTWDTWAAPGSVFTHNLVACGDYGRWVSYPEPTYRTAPGQWPVGPDFKLLPEFANLASTDGAPLGCDVDAVLGATGATVARRR